MEGPTHDRMRASTREKAMDHVRTTPDHMAFSSSYYYYSRSSLLPSRALVILVLLCSIATNNTRMMLRSVDASERDNATDEITVLADLRRRVAAIRAVDSQNPDTPYTEPLASILAGSDQLEFVRNFKMTKRNRHQGASKRGAVNAVTLRAMIVDQILYERCTERCHSPRQVVLLGAGMDTRAFRLPIPGVTWFEVDSPRVIALKERLLRDEAGVDPTNGGTVFRVGLDLDSSDAEKMISELEGVGLDTAAPSIFVLEGVVYYMTTDAVVRLLDALPSVPTSRVLLTCVDSKMTAFVNSKAAVDKLGTAFVENKRALWRTDLSKLRRAGAWAKGNRRWNTVRRVKRNKGAARRFGVVLDPSPLRGNYVIVELVSK